jgi:hypothetical protein
MPRGLAGREGAFMAILNNAIVPMRLRRADTVLEADVADHSAVRVRYLAPVVSDWCAETYPLDLLYRAGWEPVEGETCN